MPAEDNGITRREFEDLKRHLELLERDVRDIDREGSMVTRSLSNDVKELRGTQTWIVRGFIAAVGLALLAWVIIQGQGKA